MKYLSNAYALTSLIAANLVPLIGVWLWGWNVFSLMLLYWLESAIIGFFTVLKMTVAESKPTVVVNEGHSNQAVMASKLFFIPFFCVHYGLFMFVHLVFVLVMFFNPSISVWQLVVSAASLFLSHFVSYQTNFINAGEYTTTSHEQLFMKPYPRIFVMHLTIIFGGILATSTGQNVLALTLMVVLKIIADLGSHTFEHYTAQKGFRIVS
jgi:hypothetical protein